ncbi:MAG: AraC family transcriptional regulator [Lachnospiraceae bacterium]|nr:AraC family transcriptional regulator [Lachnospiraceae bacterium]
MFIYEDPQLAASPFFQPPFLPVTQLGYMERPFPWTQYPHFHEDEYELFFLPAGASLLNLPGCMQPMHEGSLCLIPPRIAHCHTGDDGASAPLAFYSIRFRASRQNTPLWERLQALPTTVVPDAENVPAICRLIDLAFDQSQKHSGKIDDLTQSLLQPALQLAAEELLQRGQTIPTNAPVYANDILTYLQQNIGNPVTMEDVSREFHLSQSHIFRVFTKTYHTSPIHYLIYCRMRQARTYILDQHLRAEEIAPKLAFNNTYHFIKTFEKFYGCPPDRYLTDGPEFREGEDASAKITEM